MSTRNVIIAVASSLLLAAPAVAQLEWRVSVKFVLDPNDPTRFPGSDTDSNCSSQQNCSSVSCNAEVQEKIDHTNELLRRFGRGYQFRVVEFIPITLPKPTFSCCTGGDKPDGSCETDDDCPNGSCDPIPTWFDAPSSNCTRAAVDEFGRDGDQAAFAWNSNAINIYVTNRCQGGVASRPPGEAIVIGQRKTGKDTRWLHEIGHFFSLCHTHGCPDSVGCTFPDPCRRGQSGSDPRVAGNDCLPDTLDDNCVWDTADDISDNNFSGRSYKQLNCTEKEKVLDVLFNVMSYHQDNDSVMTCDLATMRASCTDDPIPNVCRHRLTPDQLDTMADMSNSERVNVTNGLTRFVDGSASGAQDGSSTAPYQLVAAGLLSAAASPTTDIVLIRAGSYEETLTINFPVYLRASRGNVVLGR